MPDLTETLAERGARYGKFEDHAVIAQGLKDQMWATEGWSRLAPDQRQALEVIQDKVARILNGDPDYTDNWHDIAGYSRLVEDRLNARATAMAQWDKPIRNIIDPKDEGYPTSPATAREAAAAFRWVSSTQAAGEQPAPEPDWIEWNGGDMPVKRGALVDVRFRSGVTVERSRAGMWAWNTGYGDYDIMAYRLSPKQD